jgi:hypothetical protein
MIGWFYATGSFSIPSSFFSFVPDLEHEGAGWVSKVLNIKKCHMSEGVSPSGRTPEELAGAMQSRESLQ